MKTLLILASAAALVVPAIAGADVVTFNSTPPGAQAEGFSATGEPGLAFTSADGAGLVIGSYAESNNSPALAVFDDDSNFLIGTFSALQSSMSLDFGNDQSGFASPGDIALLRLFNGLALVGSSSVVLNLDDLMNQTVSYTGASFNRFTFAYATSAGTPIDLIELVDNINFSAAAVPEPATWAMMILGMGAIGGTMRRRKPVQTTVRFA